MTAKNIENKEKSRANEIANSFVKKSIFDMNNEELKNARTVAKKQAIAYVDGIINAIVWYTYEETTLLSSWKTVRKYITELHE